MRAPAVAGQFYPASKEEIIKMFKLFERETKVEKINNIKSAVSPHAGYIYSGFTAMHTYKAIYESHKKPPTFVIISPNHTGYGSAIAVSGEDWKTPLGDVKTDKKLAEKIVENSKIAEFDESAHTFEHAVEVQLPFLQYFYKKINFVGVTMGEQDEESAEDLAEAILKAEKQLKEKVLVIASSDFTHYESRESAHKKDKYCIEAILKLDEREFLKRKYETNASICGFAPIMVAMKYAKNKKAKKGILLDFSDSGEITKDLNVVDYASVIFA